MSVKRQLYEGPIKIPYRKPDPIEIEIYGRKFTGGFEVIDSPNQMWSCILGHDTIFRLSKILFNTNKKYFEVSLRYDIN